MIRICLVLLVFSNMLSAQKWSVEPMLGTRFDWNNLREVQGDIQHEPHGLFSFGVEVNRHPHPKLHQGIGFSRHGFGNSYIVEGELTNPLRLGGMNQFYSAVSFHHTYQFLKIERYEFEGGIGGQLFFTKGLSEQPGGLANNRSVGIEERHSGKAGVSPVGFVRANIRYRQKPTSNFTSFMRVELNVGTRALYETNVSYRTSDNEEGSGVVKNRATGFLMAFGLRYEFINF